MWLVIGKEVKISGEWKALYIPWIQGKVSQQSQSESQINFSLNQLWAVITSSIMIRLTSNSKLKLMNISTLKYFLIRFFAFKGAVLVDV